jgi:(p)ppGpp synthase/HD superfamily hydrolase
MQTAHQSRRLGPGFREALVYAAELHITQVGKETAIPYVAHLLSVAALVIEDGGDEDEAIAGLLLDAVEDKGGQRTLEIIRCRFG